MTTIWWFGKINPSRHVETENQIETPLNSKCPECTKKIGERDRGIVTVCNDGIWGAWQLMIRGELHRVISYHLNCWFAIVENGAIEGTRVEERMRGAKSEILKGLIEEPALVIPVDPADLPATEEAKPGRGWKRGEA